MRHMEVVLAGFVLALPVWLLALLSARSGHAALYAMLVGLGCFAGLAAAAVAQEFSRCYTVLGPEKSDCGSAKVLSTAALAALGVFALATLLVALWTFVGGAVADEGTSEASRDSTTTAPDVATTAAPELPTAVRAPYRPGLVGILERISDHLGIGFDDEQSPKE